MEEFKKFIKGKEIPLAMLAVIVVVVIVNSLT